MVELSAPYVDLPGQRRDSSAVHGLDALWLALAGVGAGLSGSVAGLASLVSYPALLAAGPVHTARCWLIEQPEKRRTVPAAAGTGA